jgi:lysozyme family protein
LIEREGGYVNHPADKGGPTCFGITETVRGRPALPVQ